MKLYSKYSEERILQTQDDRILSSRITLAYCLFNLDNMELFLAQTKNAITYSCCTDLTSTSVQIVKGHSKQKVVQLVSLLMDNMSVLFANNIHKRRIKQWIV